MHYSVVYCSHQPLVHRHRIDTHHRSRSLASCATIFVASAVPEIPVSVYETFVLEERHGLNKTTPPLFISDLLKTCAFGLAIGGPFLCVSLRVQMGRRPLCSMAHGIPVRCPHCLNLAEVLMKRIKAGVPWVHGDSLHPTAIQPLFNKLPPLPSGELRSRTEALAGKLKFPLKHLTVTRTFSVYHGCVRPTFCRESRLKTCEYRASTLSSLIPSSKRANPANSKP